MVLQWWEISILLLTIFVVVMLLWAYFGAPTLKHAANTSLEDFYKNSDNGDLIFFSGDTRGERACRWASNSPFSHVGFLFREKHPETEEEVLYIWEADIGQGSRTGPRLMKVKDKIKRYKGLKTFGWRPFQGTRPKTKDILAVVEKHSQKKLDSQMWSWVFSKYFGETVSFWVKDQRKVFCSELLALTLQDLKMMNPTSPPHSYSPQDFLEIYSLRYSPTNYIDIN